jgi:hypothetical protein
MYSREYLIGVQLFNRGDWFESHEAWEDVWNETAGREKDFYQGLIQLAVGLCHYFNGNVRGAQKLYDRSLSYLEPFRPRWQGLDLERLFEASAECFAPVIGADPESWISMGDESRAPQLLLDPPPAEWPNVEQWRSHAIEDDPQ